LFITDTCSEPNNELASDLCVHEFLLDQIRVFLQNSTTITLSGKTRTILDAKILLALDAARKTRAVPQHDGYKNLNCVKLESQASSRREFFKVYTELLLLTAIGQRPGTMTF
jgi:hypothetical protein